MLSTATRTRVGAADRGGLTRRRGIRVASVSSAPSGVPPIDHAMADSTQTDLARCQKDDLVEAGGSNVLPGVSELGSESTEGVGRNGRSELSEGVTELLLAWSDGDQQALDRLVPLVYVELKRRASAQLARERSSHTLQPTALVHETFLKLVDQRRAHFQNRAQFFGVSARLMRRILVDHARTRGAAKRGGGALRLTLEDAHGTPTIHDTDVLLAHQALERLAEQDERLARVVELRYFGGLSVEEVAVVLGVSEITVKRDWAMAKAWLFRELTRGLQPQDGPTPG